MKNLIEESIVKIVDDVVADYDHGRIVDNLDVHSIPSTDAIIEIIDKLLRILYPGYHIDRTYKTYNIRTTIATVAEDVAYRLCKQIALALKFDEEYANKCDTVIQKPAEEVTLEFLEALPRIREYLDTHVHALSDGDPASESPDAIIICYPGLYAITVYRLAHEFYELNVPIIPRIMTEYAHSKTGIDINPGAKIGKYFFIDHGTGIVIGETTVIGNNVKLYQGVTLGALSLKEGRGLLDVRRHPTIEDNVTIYSNASILGGETIIGHDSIVGGNVFLTRSIPAGTKVYAKAQELHFATDVDTPEVQDVTQTDNQDYVI